ncbi:hypothetical protein EDB89DRAFT_1905545 [Lactarius sanguifluus]|nr:hypothetical protein EDB89DRAFT_1905545 [Lactarius sanguifluus]
MAGREVPGWHALMCPPFRHGRGASGDRGGVNHVLPSMQVGKGGASFKFQKSSVCSLSPSQSVLGLEKTSLNQSKTGLQFILACNLPPTTKWNLMPILEVDAWFQIIASGVKPHLAWHFDTHAAPWHYDRDTTPWPIDTHAVCHFNTDDTDVE